MWKKDISKKETVRNVTSYAKKNSYWPIRMIYSGYLAHDYPTWGYLFTEELEYTIQIVQSKASTDKLSL